MSSLQSAEGTSSRFPLRFQDEFRAVIQAALESRRSEWGAANPSGKLELLDDPSRESPFMTLVDTGTADLRLHVVKVLVLPTADPAFSFWEKVLDEGMATIEADARVRLRTRDVITRLNLPLTTPELSSHRGQLGPFRSQAIFANGDDRVEAGVGFPYVARPYIPWPRLDEVGLDRAQRRELWEQYRKAFPFDVDDEEESFARFCRAALVGTEPPTWDSLFLVSRWRFTPSTVSREPTPRKAFWKAVRAWLSRWRTR